MANKQKFRIDPGFGDFKWSFNGKTGKVSTAVKRADEQALKFGLTARDIELNTNEFLFNGGRWFVGNSIAEMGALSTRDYSFIEKFAPVIVYKCFLDAGVDLDKPIELKTCLSILNYKSHKDSFKKALSVINVNNRVINCDVDVIAQGFASFIDYLSTNSINDVKGLYTATNIGFNTVDFVAILDGEVVFATANPNGVNAMIRPLKQKLDDRFKDVYFNEQEVKNIFLDGYVEISGKRVDLTDEVNTIKVNYFETFFYSLPDVNDYMRKSKKNILAGGGVYFLEEAELADNMVFVEKPYEYSDVRGVASYE